MSVHFVIIDAYFVTINVVCVAISLICIAIDVVCGAINVEVGASTSFASESKKMALKRSSELRGKWKVKAPLYTARHNQS
jgi:hypothetical protein